MKIANWVRTADPAAFPFTSMPAYTVIPMMPCLFFMRLWTVALAFLSTIVFWYMARKGYTLIWMVNRVSGKLHGNRLSARPIWFIRRFSMLSDPVQD